MRSHDSMKQLYLVHSFIEIFFTVFVVVIHMLNARMGYVTVRHTVERLEHFDVEKDKELGQVRRWMWLLVAAGFVHIGVSVGCFIVFHVCVHLGWTVLSNQVCILSINTLTAIYASVVTAAVIKIKDDQQQVNTGRTIICFYRPRGLGSIQSPPSVTILYLSTLTFCMCMGHDHSSPEIDGQGQRSTSTLTLSLTPTP